MGNFPRVQEFWRLTCHLTSFEPFQIQDLYRTGLAVRKLSRRWGDFSDPSFASYLNSLGRNNIADAAFVMLAKIQQLTALGAHPEARALYDALEANDLERNHSSALPAFKSIMRRKIAMEVASYIKRR